MSFTLYRAMCSEEARKTTSKPNFVSRWKWFSPSLEFVTQRVQGGEFNNSQFKPERYTNLVEFTFSDDSLEYFVVENDKEWKLDRRDIQMVTCEKLVR